MRVYLENKNGDATPLVTYHKVVVVDPDGDQYPLLPATPRTMASLKAKKLNLRSRPWYYNVDDPDDVWPAPRPGFTVKVLVG